MEIAHVDRLLEAVFDEEPPGEGGIGPAPNRLKKFFPPDAAAAPAAAAAAPAVDPDALWRTVENAYRSEFLRSSGQDINAWEQAKDQIKADFQRNPAAQAKARERAAAGGGRTGVPLSQLVPKNEWAGKDDLVDFYSRASREQDPARQAAMMKEFGAHKTEFEARLQKFVDNLIEG